MFKEWGTGVDYHDRGYQLINQPQPQTDDDGLPWSGSGGVVLVLVIGRRGVPIQLTLMTMMINVFAAVVVVVSD